MAPGAGRAAAPCARRRSARASTSCSRRAVGTALSAAVALEAERRRSEALAELDRLKTRFLREHLARVPHAADADARAAGGRVGEPAAGGRSPSGSSSRTATRCGCCASSTRCWTSRAARAAGRGPRRSPRTCAALTAQLGGAFETAIELAGLTLGSTLDDLVDPVQVGPGAWERILLNLMSNAIKHTFEGSITIRGHERDGMAVIEVTDTGVGIPPEHRDRVFDRFHRVPDARSRSHEGSGIGLALVADLIARAGRLGRRGARRGRRRHDVHRDAAARAGRARGARVRRVGAHVTRYVQEIAALGGRHPTRRRMPAAWRRRTRRAPVSSTTTPTCATT